MLDTEWFTMQGGAVARASPWDELLRRHERERAAILRWEERTTDNGGDETEMAFDHDTERGASTAGEQSPAQQSSRATTPDLYFDR